MNKAASLSLKSCLFDQTEQTESLSKPVSAQTIRRTLHQMKPLLKMMHKKARKQFAEDKQTSCEVDGLSR